MKKIRAPRRHWKRCKLRTNFRLEKKDKKTHGESENKQNKTENNDNKKLHFLVKLETWGHIGKFPNELVVLR